MNLLDVLSILLAVGCLALGAAIGWKRGKARGLADGVRVGVNVGIDMGMASVATAITDECTEITHRLLDKLEVDPERVRMATCEIEEEDRAAEGAGLWGGSITAADLERIYRKV